jgi:hypothetical protein
MATNEPTTLRHNRHCLQFRSLATNVPTLGEGGDLYHKCQCGERMLNIAVNVERSTEPPLLPNVC